MGFRNQQGMLAVGLPFTHHAISKVDYLLSAKYWGNTG